MRATVFCPFCGHEQALAGHEELSQFEQTVARRLAHADEQHMVAASLEAWTSSPASNVKRNLLMIYGLMVGAPLLIALALVGALRLGLVDAGSGPALTMGIGASSYVGLIAYFVWYFARRKKVRARRAERAPVGVACPSCGAPGQLVPGAALDKCAFCGAALIVSRTMMARGIDAAKAAQREASMARHRAQRLAMARATNLGAANLFMPVMIIGSILLMLGSGTVIFSVKMLRGEEPFNPAIFVLWGLTLGFVAVVAQVFSRRRDRRDRLRAALADVTRQLGGELIVESMGRVGWLNRFWIGDYEQAHLIQTYVACSAAVDVHGFAVLIDIDLHAQKPPPRFDLLLAAWVPEVSDGVQPSRRVKHAALSELGFTVRETEAGLWARGEKKLLDACRRDPGVAHVAAPALTMLAALARERGSVPVDALAS